MSHETFKAPDLEHLAELLPAYDFQAFIAQGGMGAVYKARQRSLDRDVAIKVLPRELGADPEFHKSFETEAKAMARLNHPNLIGVYDFGSVDGMPYIVMEFVNGKSLYHSAWNKAIEPEQAVKIAKGICDGLGHAHDNGVVHRDIKPANILLTPKAEAKIGDFGLAHPTGSEGPGLVMGTPGYSAPEVYTSPEKIDKRSDVFALGVILHELLTGQRPDPDGKQPMKSCGNLRLDAIWKKATLPHPNQRFQDADSLGKALQGWLDTRKPKTAGSGAALLASGTNPPPSPGSSSTDSTANGPTPAQAPQVASPSGSNWGLVRNLIIIAVLVVAIGFTYKLLKQKKADRDAANARAKTEQYEKDQLAKAQREIEERRARELAAAAKAAAEANQPAPPPAEKKETAMESLERLRRDLAKGERAEMPIGTTRQGEFDYFLVTTPMTWYAAADFAEKHGGFLATVREDNDLTRLAEMVPDDASIWVGAGRYGKRDWVLVDGSDWQLPSTPSGVGDYAALNDLGLLRARKVEESYPFVVQWSRDGSNPASLGAILRRTRRTLDTPNPVFPPGTFALGARRFVIIPREINHAKAKQLAEQSGGHLAAPATEEEADALASAMESLTANTGFWLGGSRSSDGWNWNLGETWDHEAWATQAPDDPEKSALVVIPGKGWAAANPDTKASGLVIEWSNDGGKVEGDAGVIAQGNSNLPDLRNKAVQLIKEAQKEKQNQLAANARTFNWDLDVWVRGLNRQDAAIWTNEVMELKSLVKDNRVPAAQDFGPDSDVKLSEQMAKVCSFGHKKQVEIDAAYEYSVSRLHEAFITRLKKEADEANGRGDFDQAKALNKEAASLGKPNEWAASLVSE